MHVPPPAKPATIESINQCLLGGIAQKRGRKFQMGHELPGNQAITSWAIYPYRFLLLDNNFSDKSKCIPLTPDDDDDDDDHHHRNNSLANNDRSIKAPVEHPLRVICRRYLSLSRPPHSTLLPFVLIDRPIWGTLIVLSWCTRVDCSPIYYITHTTTINYKQGATIHHRSFFSVIIGCSCCCYFAEEQQHLPHTHTCLRLGGAAPNNDCNLLRGGRQS